MNLLFQNPNTRDKGILRIEERVMMHSTSMQGELLRWHYRLGHINFNNLKMLSILGKIPKNLAKIKAPKCATCIYRGMTRIPWRTKGQQSNINSIQFTKPDQCMSIDQMESSAPGLIAQLKGKLTRDRYTYATVYIDHASTDSYVYLQRNTSSNETFLSKCAFEQEARVDIQHYHCNNGRFSDNLFQRDVIDKDQSMSQCGVNAHFQNGIAEKMIRVLQDHTRKSFLHAKVR